jgi:hypothetical protein
MKRLARLVRAGSVKQERASSDTEQSPELTIGSVIPAKRRRDEETERHRDREEGKDS